MNEDTAPLLLVALVAFAAVLFASMIAANVVAIVSHVTLLAQ